MAYPQVEMFIGWIKTGIKHIVRLLPTIVSRLDEMKFGEMLDTADIPGILKGVGFEKPDDIFTLFIDPETGDIDVIGILVSMRELFESGLITEIFEMSKESPLFGLTRLKEKDIVPWSDMEWMTLFGFMLNILTRFLDITIRILPVIVTLATELFKEADFEVPHLDEIRRPAEGKGE